jgi:hypothetical protein
MVQVKEVESNVNIESSNDENHGVERQQEEVDRRRNEVTKGEADVREKKEKKYADRKDEGYAQYKPRKRSLYAFF